MGSPDVTSEVEAPDELGVHVSAAGGVDRAPGRAVEIECNRLQLFTKQPSRWAEPTIDESMVASFAKAREQHGIETAVSHDSYLINLASPDRLLWERSLRCFRGELERCVTLGLDFLVTHPGNATDGDLDAGIERNAEGIGRALADIHDPTVVLLELTAGSGTSIGDTFERLSRLITGIPQESRPRVGVCLDTCHAFAAGYDLSSDWDGVWARFDDVLGLDRLRLFHVNDSKHPLGSRKDRHEHLGRGCLGREPFRRLMNDERFHGIPKLLETPKEGDPLRCDVMNLEFLRNLREG
jgi:deoxyribonuclease-4